MLKNRLLSVLIDVFLGGQSKTGECLLQWEHATSVIQTPDSLDPSMVALSWCSGSDTFPVLPVKASVTDWAVRTLQGKEKGRQRRNIQMQLY